MEAEIPDEEIFIDFASYERDEVISNSNNDDYMPSANETSSTDTESDHVTESLHNIDKSSALGQELPNVIEKRKRTKRAKVTNNNTWKRQENKIKHMKGEDYLSVKFSASEKNIKLWQKLLEK